MIENARSLSDSTLTYMPGVSWVATRRSSDNDIHEWERTHVDPAQLGVSYYLAVLNVPAMIVFHVIISAYLLGRVRTPGSA